MKENDRGFTLIELICVTAILGLITVSIFSFILAGEGMAKETKKSAALSENSRTAIGKMKTDIMNCGTGIVGSNAVTVDADGSVTYKDATSESGTLQDLGSTFFLITKDGETTSGNDTYTLSCYRYDSGSIYYGRAKGVALSENLTTNEAIDMCSPTHRLCPNVSVFQASVLPYGETVRDEKDGSVSTIVRASRVHLILTLDKDDKSFHTQQDVALRSETRFFNNFSDAFKAIG